MDMLHVVYLSSLDGNLDCIQFGPAKNNIAKSIHVLVFL